MIILSVSVMLAFLLGSWVTYRAYQHKAPVEIPQIIKDIADDLPEPLSPYEQEKKQRTVRVKV
jgi:hypothetical protein